jgi:hypothetical protein
MAMSAEPADLASLGEDLLLLHPGLHNTIETPKLVGYGLMGSELIRLCAARRIEVTDRQVIVRSEAPTGDPGLDAALFDLAMNPRRRPRPPALWVRESRPAILMEYLNRLVRAGVLRDEQGFGGGRRFRVADQARVAAARARLDAIVQADGVADLPSVARASLVCATGLDRLVYRGPGSRRLREQLAVVAAGPWSATEVQAPVPLYTGFDVDPDAGPDPYAYFDPDANPDLDASAYAYPVPGAVAAARTPPGFDPGPPSWDYVTQPGVRAVMFAVIRAGDHR